jgi:glycosyltransferase involved in cell wall biosynthesis
MMRIAIYTDNDFGKVNGVTTTLQALLQWTPPDMAVRIYTADATGAAEAHYLALRSIGVGIPFYREMKIYVPRLWSYLQHARDDRIDVVHMTTPGPVGLAALFVASRLGVPLVGSFHTDLARYTALLSRSERLGRIMNEYLRWPYGRCARVLVPSNATAAALTAAGVAPGKHAIWQRGVDTDSFAPARRSSSLREHWGADPRTPVVMYLGRVSREKNLAAFVAVHERLVREGLRYRLVLVGDGPMRSEIQRLLPHAILTGSIPHRQVGEYLASADVFAFPSRTDTAGNVVLEAQACGLPAVVCDEGGPRENVWPGQSALVADSREHSSFADAVTRLVRDGGLRAELASGARRFALTRDWPTALEPLFTTYRELFVRHHATPALTPVICKTHGSGG